MGEIEDEFEDAPTTEPQTPRPRLPSRPNPSPQRRRIVMVTGSREWSHERPVFDDLDDFAPHVVIHGGARGLDEIAHEWCKMRGVVAHVHFPNYKRDGYKAPLFRNKAMARELRRMVDVYAGDGRAFAYPTKKSRGTWHAIRCLQEMGFEPLIREGL